MSIVLGTYNQFYYMPTVDCRYNVEDNNNIIL